MSIKENLLRSAGAVEEHYDAGDYIFYEEAHPQFYYQILEGQVKLNNYNEDGKEFIQNIFSGPSCFGEPMLFLEKPYPVNAVALSGCTVLKVHRDQFMQLLKVHPDLYFDICRAISENTYNKFVLMRKISSKSASERLLEVMDMLKESQEKKDKFSFEIPHTRQQLASLTGLRVETAIRAIKQMEERKILKIRNRKIFY